MLAFINTAILFASLTAFTSTSAVAIPAPVDQAPSIVCIYMCEDAHFAGRCQNFCGSPGLCYNLEADWNNKVSSLRVPDAETSGCTLFPFRNCTGRVRLEGVRGSLNNLVTQNFNDKASSWICY